MLDKKLDAIKRRRGERGHIMEEQFVDRADSYGISPKCVEAEMTAVAAEFAVRAHPWRRRAMRRMTK